MSSSQDQTQRHQLPGGCTQCGARVADDMACDTLFHEVGLRLQGDPALLDCRTQFIDAYCCQHEPYIRSDKSFAAHLVGLCLAMEHGQTGPPVSILISRWLNGRGPQDVSKPSCPIPRASITIGDVAQAGSSAELQVLVKRFAESVWAAWNGEHGTVRRWA